MINEIYDNLMESEKEDEEKIAFFMERTQDHIQRVQNAAAKIAQALSEFSELVDQAETHDASKFEEPEKTPYIDLTWTKKLEKETGKKFDSAPEVTQATLYHIKNNQHHPEFHLKDKTKANLSSTNRDESIECIDATVMPDMDVAEMVADWQAMSEELGTNTAREWFDDVKDVRWHFTEEQEALIDKLIKVFE